MDGINQKYNLEIEVLTPLSIGAGAEKDWVRGVDFVVDKGQLYKLNLKKMIANGIKVDDLTSYFASKNEEGLKSKLAGKLDACSDFTIPFPVESDNDVKAFVKNQFTGNPVLPGSSLKGSIRSVILDYLATKDEIDNAVSEANRRRKPFESFIFGSSTEGDEFLRFIKISDAEFDKTELVNTKIFNLRGRGNNWQGGWKHQMTNRDGNSYTNGTFQSTGFNTLYESIVPKQKGYASLMMSSTLYDNFERYKSHIKTEKKRFILQNGVSKLFAIINQHTKYYLEKERAFFEKYATDRTGEIVNSIDSLLTLIPFDNSYCILKMSAGSGFHSITGDWQFDDYSINGLDTSKKVSRGLLNGDKSTKSRKIAECNGNLSLMGFVKLRNLNDEELQSAKTKLLYEKKRKEEELKAKQEAEQRLWKEQEELKLQFNNVISEIEQLMSDERYEEAYAKYNFVTCNYPEFKQNKIDVNYLKGCVDYILSEQERKEEAAKHEQERIQAQKEKAEGGLSKLLNEKYEQGPNEGKYKVVAFKVCAQKVTSWMKAANVNILPTAQHPALHETVIRLAANPDKKELKSWNDSHSSIWTQLSSFVGPDTATAWFHEITGNFDAEN